MVNEEDLCYIEKLKTEIICRAGQMTYDNLNFLSKGRIEKMFISADCKQMQKRKSAEKYSFFTENEMNVALYLFFSNMYNAKRIARSCYILDEDTKFNESMDTGVPLGKIVLPNGGIMVSSIVEAVLKVRRYDEINLITGMPFDVVSFRIIA